MVNSPRKDCEAKFTPTDMYLVELVHQATLHKSMNQYQSLLSLGM